MEENGKKDGPFVFYDAVHTYSTKGYNRSSAHS